MFIPIILNYIPVLAPEISLLEKYLRTNFKKMLSAHSCCIDIECFLFKTVYTIYEPVLKIP